VQGGSPSISEIGLLGPRPPRCRGSWSAEDVNGSEEGPVPKDRPSRPLVSSRPPGRLVRVGAVVVDRLCGPADRPSSGQHRVAPGSSLHTTYAVTACAFPSLTTSRYHPDGPGSAWIGLPSSISSKAVDLIMSGGGGESAPPPTACIPAEQFTVN
jgi:hypothetical protein